MVIRFKKYQSGSETITAVRLTDKNVAEVVAYVSKNGGTILDETQVFKDTKFQEGAYTAVKVSIVQRVRVGGRIRKSIRKAFRGDFIVRNELETPKGKQKYEFFRIRDAGVNDWVAV